MFEILVNFCFCRSSFGTCHSPYWGVNWVQPHTINNVMIAWTRRLKRSGPLGLEDDSIVIWWSTWKERNHRISEDKARSYQELELSS